MYRYPKYNEKLCAEANGRVGKHGAKALLFSSIALVTNSLSITGGSINVLGLKIGVQNDFLIKGILCSVALYFGILTLFAFMEFYLYGGNREAKYWSKLWELYTKVPI